MTGFVRLQAAFLRTLCFVPIVAHFTRRLGWLCSLFLLPTLRSDLIWFRVVQNSADVTAGLDSVSLLPTLRSGLIGFPYSGQCRDHFLNCFVGSALSPCTPGSSISVLILLRTSSTSAPLLGVFRCANSCDLVATLRVDFMCSRLQGDLLALMRAMPLL